MAIPALPADDSDSNDWNASKVNAIYDHLQLWRDTRPVFKGQMLVTTFGSGQDVLTGTNTTFGAGLAGTFGTTPDINVGSWTTQASDADPESLVVPESGIYWVQLHAQWTSDATGLRRVALIVDGTRDDTIFNQILSAGVATYQNCSGLIDVASGAQLDAQMQQTSGSTLQATVFLSAVWMQST